MFHTIRNSELLVILIAFIETVFVFCFFHLQGHYNSLIQAASEVHEQGAIDDRDTFLHAVRDLLCIHSSKKIPLQSVSSLNLFLFSYSSYCLLFPTDSQAAVPTYMSAHALVQQISALQSDLLSLQSELESTLPADRKRCINEL